MPADYSSILYAILRGFAMENHTGPEKEEQKKTCGSESAGN